MKLNCDIGESFGHWRMGMDEAIMPHIDMANIACGFHASDPFTMAKTVKLAKENNVSIGAHPGYPDLLGFGRRAMSFSVDEIKAMITYQFGALNAICHTYGTQVDYIKPHGALYHCMMNDEAVLFGILELMTQFHTPVALMVMANSQADHIQTIASSMNVKVLFEAFCDRAYDDNGHLVSRGVEGAILTNTEIENRIDQLVNEQIITTISGKRLSIKVDTLCVHGDDQQALESVKKVRNYLKQC